MAGEKSSEGIKPGKQATHGMKPAPTSPRPPAPKSTNVGDIKITADVSDALKGLKAVQREAKKATAALKELEGQKKRNNTISGYNPHTVVFDEMHTTCPACGGTNRERKPLTTRDGGVYAVEITCLDCGRKQ